MNKYLAGSIFTLLALTGCNNAKTTSAAQQSELETSTESEDVDVPPVEDVELEELIAEEPMPVAAEELFDDFIFNFASNRRLQMERIDFPLIVNSGSKKDTITAQEWKMEYFFMREGEYTLILDSPEQMDRVKDTTVSSATVEKIFLEEAFVRQYLFTRRNGQWRLYEIRNQTLPRNPNASFIEFYHHFVTDSAFQHESLSDEIAFIGPDPDDDFSQMEGVITPDFWDAFAPDLPQRMLFNVVYGPQDSLSTEKTFVLRGISNGMELEINFQLEDGHWKLKRIVE